MPTFSTTFSPPAAPSGFTIEADVEASAIRLTWDASFIPQVDFAGFKVYRSTDGVGYELIALLPLVGDVAYNDFEAPLNVGLFYRLTQSDLDYESDPIEAVIQLASPMWWVVVPEDLTLTFPIPKIRAASATSSKVQDVFAPIGRPARLVVGDVVQTDSGQLSFLVMPDNPGMIALLKRILARMDGAIILKAPNGDIHHVQYGDMQRSFTKIPGLYEVTLSFVGAS